MPKQTVTLVSPHLGTAADAAVDLTAGPLAVRSRRLSGGRREGVLLVELVAGDTKVFILPDRGLGIWKMLCGGV